MKCVELSGALNRCRIATSVELQFPTQLASLELEMRGRIKLTPSQFRAAKELLPYETAKSTAVAVGHFDQNSFAAALERAIERSKQPPPPAALPAPRHPASEVRGPFVIGDGAICANRLPNK